MATSAGNICVPECLGVKNTGAVGVCTEVANRAKSTRSLKKTPSLQRKTSKADRKFLKDKKSTTDTKRLQLRKVKSRELYSGVVYIDCDCYHRNGLQHDCPRLACGGPPCRVKPWPECDMAVHFMDKWDKYYELLDRLPPTSFCGPREKWFALLEEEERKLREKREKLRAKHEIETKTKAPLKDEECEEVASCGCPSKSVQTGPIADQYLLLPLQIEKI